IAVVDEDGRPSVSFRSDEEATVVIDFTVLRTVPNLRLLVTLTDANREVLLRTENIDSDLEGPWRFEPGDYRSTVTFPRGLLGDARLDLNVSLLAEANQVLDYPGVAEVGFPCSGHGATTHARASLRPQLSWRPRP